MFFWKNGFKIQRNKQIAIFPRLHLSVINLFQLADEILIFVFLVVDRFEGFWESRTDMWEDFWILNGDSSDSQLVRGVEFSRATSEPCIYMHDLRYRGISSFKGLSSWERKLKFDKTCNARIQNSRISLITHHNFWTNPNSFVPNNSKILCVIAPF